MIQLSEAGRTYAGPPPVTALYPCSLTINEADYVAITGPSGSGKSTLLNLLGLLDVPTTGEIHVDGRAVAGVADAEHDQLRAQTIGFMFQSFHLIGHQSALANVELGAVYTGQVRGSRRANAREELERVGLGDRAQALASTLSGGERQRVALARAMIKRPRVLLCDEPTGNLDSVNSENVLNLLESLRKDGVALVVVTHDPDIADRAARRVVVRDGHASIDPPRPAPA